MAPDGENGAMARAEIDVAAPPETVWAVLAEPAAYGEWVVGTKVTRADASWPTVGSSLEFRVEVGPLGAGDRTPSSRPSRRACSFCGRS